MASGKQVEHYIDLSVARAGQGEFIGTSGKRIQVMGASDPTAIALVALRQEGITPYRDMIDQAFIYDGQGFDGFYVQNSVQAGAWIKLVVSDDQDDFVYSKPTTNNIGSINTPVQTTGGKTQAGSAVSVGTTQTPILSANNNRTSFTLTNEGSVKVYIGAATVTTATGTPVYPGEKYGEDYRGALYAIVASGTADLRVREVSI